MTFTSTPQPSFQSIALDHVRPHPDLQRPINEAWVKRIMKAWNPDAFGVPILAPIIGEPGWFWCVAGQHRLEAAKRLGMSHVFCSIMADSSEEAMAQAYIDEQAQREQHPLIKHRIALAANNPTAVGVQSTCERMDYRIPSAGVDRTSARGVIQAMRPAYQLFERGTLEDVLRIIDLAFDKNYLACQGWFLGSLGTFLIHADRCKRNNTGTYDEAAFIEALRREAITSVYNRWAARKGVDSAAGNVSGACVLVDVYNKGRRTKRLPMVDSIHFTASDKAA